MLDIGNLNFSKYDGYENPVAGTLTLTINKNILYTNIGVYIL